MTKQDQSSPSLYRPLGIAAGVGLVTLFALASMALPEQRSPSFALPSYCFPPAPQNATSAAAYAIELLPVISPSSPTTSSSLLSGDAPSLEGPLPGEAPPNPDDFRVLYGYRGPDYNTAALDGKVVVLPSSLYTWPTSTWKVTGLFRNQTRCPIHINSVSARLLGSQGELLETATATLLVDNIRPGEPAPLVIEAPLSPGAVKTVEWAVDSSPTPTPIRQFEFAIWSAEKAPDGASYTLDGMITSDASTTARGTSVVVAWLDENNRVLYVDSTKMNPYVNPADSVDLPGHAKAGFLYSTKDLLVAPVLGGAADLALWGVSR
jgi:hypothetical protein